MYRFLGYFYSRTYGLFIPELVDFLFPNLLDFYSRTCGLFIPELVDFLFLMLCQMWNVLLFIP